MKTVTWLGGQGTTTPSGRRAAWAEPETPGDAAGHSCVPIGPRALGSACLPLHLLATRLSGPFIDSLIHSAIKGLRVHLLVVV